jgi:hypothetical protein
LGILNPVPGAARGLAMTDTYLHVSDLPSKIALAKIFFTKPKEPRDNQRPGELVTLPWTPRGGAKI